MLTETSIVEKYSSSALIPQSIPLDFLWLELTNRCNLQCAHCYSESSPYGGDRDFLSPEHYRQLLSEASALGCKQIQFIGGEPTLNPKLPTLIRAAAADGFEFIEVFTNLVKLDEELLAAILASNAHIATSFYSAQRTTHEQITRTFGSFNKTVANIKRVIAAGVSLRVGVIEMAQNAGEFAETETFLQSIGVSTIRLDKVRQFGRAQQDSVASMNQLCGKCAGNILAIGPDGVVAPCIMSKHWSIGSAIEQRLSEIATSPALLSVRKAIALATAHNTTNCYPNCGPQNQNCGPECNPSSHCTPCAPNGGHKCEPNRWCSPAQ